MIIIIIMIIIYIYLLKTTECFEDDDIYNFKVSQVFKKMFKEPSVWQGYQSYDAEEEPPQKLYVKSK